MPNCQGSYSSVIWTNCFGAYTWADGNKYVGEFRDGKFNGQGTFTWGPKSEGAGDKYVGEYRDDKRTGQGTFTWGPKSEWAGDKYVGEYRDDKRTGQGTYTDANGNKYDGEWRDGKRTGQGTYTDANGTVTEGIWKDGTFQYAQKTPFASKPSLLQVAFTQLSQFQRKQVQSILSNLGLYNSSIDGLYGKGTAKALTSYNKQNLNGADLTKNENAGKLINAILSLEPSPSTQPKLADNATPDQDNEVISASSGSGFAVSADGYVITNHHVIEGCQKVVVHYKGKELPVTVVTYDPQNDLALLKGDFRPQTVFALSGNQPELLQDVYVAGYPFGNKISSSVKVTKGIISSLTGIGNNFSNIQIDAALQSGNSGGPILDEMGNIVGVAVSKLDAKYMYDNFGIIPENTNFGIKANVVRSVLESNEVSSPPANRSEISKSQLGKMISSGTYYISCWMTMAQVEKLRTKKVMFEHLE